MPCQSHCLRLMGLQTQDLQPTPRLGGRAKATTLLYDVCFTQHGQRTMDSNFPITAELCPLRRWDYSAHREKSKRPKTGRWRRGVPTSKGGLLGLGCALRAEGRERRQTSTNTSFDWPNIMEIGPERLKQRRPEKNPLKSRDSDSIPPKTPMCAGVLPNLRSPAFACLLNH